MKKKIKKYFIPHKENDYQPHLLRDNFAVFILIAVILFEVVGLFVFTPIFSGKFDYLSAVFPSVLVSKTNQERLDVGKNELKANELLTLSAQLKANDMAEKGYFAHVSSDGKDPWYWVNLSGYEYKNAGENLAVNFVDSTDVHKAWMNSPTHKENILRNGFTEIGIATAEGVYKGKKAIFVAQFFGEPADKVITAKTEKKVISDIPKEKNKEFADDSEIFVVEDKIEETADVLVLGVETSNGEDFVDAENLNWYQKILASPKTTMSYVLYLFGFVVLLSIFLKIFVEIKKQYPKLILNGIVVLIVIAGLIYLNYLIPSLFSEIL